MLSGSASVKAVHRTLMKLSLGGGNRISKFGVTAFTFVSAFQKVNFSFLDWHDRKNSYW